MEKANKEHKVTMERIKSHFVLGRFCFFGPDVGWRFYPIEYYGRIYTVEMECRAYFTGKSPKDVKITAIGTIYEYADNGNYFHKHRSKKIYSATIDTMKIDDNLILNVLEVSEEEFLSHYPQIIAGLFKLYEDDRLNKEIINENIQRAYDWNGVVK